MYTQHFQLLLLFENVHNNIGGNKSNNLILLPKNLLVTLNNYHCLYSDLVLIYFSAVSDNHLLSFETLFCYSKLFPFLSVIILFAFSSPFYSQTVGALQGSELSATLNFFPQKIHFHCFNYHFYRVNNSRHSISSAIKSPISNCLLSILTSMSHVIIILSTKLRTGIPLPYPYPCGTQLPGSKQQSYFLLLLLS